MALLAAWCAWLASPLLAGEKDMGSGCGSLIFEVISGAKKLSRSLGKFHFFIFVIAC
jgi:hypothetical protein